MASSKLLGSLYGFQGDVTLMLLHDCEHRARYKNDSIFFRKEDNVRISHRQSSRLVRSPRPLPLRPLVFPETPQRLQTTPLKIPPIHLVRMFRPIHATTLNLCKNHAAHLCIPQRRGTGVPQRVTLVPQ